MANNDNLVGPESSANNHHGGNQHGDDQHGDNHRGDDHRSDDHHGANHHGDDHHGDNHHGDDHHSDDHRGGQGGGTHHGGTEGERRLRERIQALIAANAHHGNNIVREDRTSEQLWEDIMWHLSALANPNLAWVLYRLMVRYYAALMQEQFELYHRPHRPSGTGPAAPAQQHRPNGV
jgi:hypothetical protein